MALPSSIKSQQSSKRPILWPFSSPIMMVALIALTTATLLIFNANPGIDRIVSSWFFEEVQCSTDSLRTICGNFPAAENPFLDGLRDFFHYLPIITAVGLVIAATVTTRKKPGSRLSDFAIGVYVAVAGLVVSALFIVNLWLKSHSGRPRPLQTDLFGGDLPFVPAGTFSEFCETNCSFVSGESSGAFWLVCVVALVPRQWQPFAFAITLSIAIFVAGLRVSFGAHYLSDVTIAGLLTLTIFSVLAFITAKIITSKTNTV